MKILKTETYAMAFKFQANCQFDIDLVNRIIIFVPQKF